jgi:hypothetical protein
MKKLTNDEIRAMVYSKTLQETSPDIEHFIQGAIWGHGLAFPEGDTDPEWIYERDGNNIYRRRPGSEPSTRQLLL